MIEFFIPGQPPTATAQQKGQNRWTGAYYKPAALKDAEAHYMAWAARNRPPQPLEGAIWLTVTFGFRPTKQHPDGTPKTTRPDTDNMIKLLKDCMTKCGYWRDDAQVALEIVLKSYCDPPGVRVTVQQLDEVVEHGA